MGDFESGDDQSNPGCFECSPLGKSDRLRNRHQVGGGIGIQIEPVIDLCTRDNQCVPGSKRIDREECNGNVIAPDETSGQLACDDACEQCGHGCCLAGTLTRNLRMSKQVVVGDPTVF